MLTERDLIAEAREMCVKATPGPWEAGLYNSISLKSGFILGHIEGSGNAALIARSRTIIPELCDALESLKAQLAERDAEIAVLKNLAIQGDRYHIKYSACLVETDTKDAEIERMRKAICSYCHNDCYRDACTGNEDVGIPDCPMAAYRPPLPQPPKDDADA